MTVVGLSKGYRIGELATLTGLTRDALRYYEREGLLDRPARTPGRFRIYTSSAIERVRFIKRAQALGFTLAEIQELVRYNGKAVTDPGSWRSPAEWSITLGEPSRQQ